MSCKGFFIYFVCLKHLKQSQKMLVIGIAGGTGSGKTTVVNKIIRSLPEGEVAVLPQDSTTRTQATYRLKTAVR